MIRSKTRILFVGSFKSQTKDGSIGGLMFACNSLLESEFSKNFDFILLDTSALSNKPSAFIIRLLRAIHRVVLYIYYLIFRRVDKCLIFAGDGWGLWEKGLMVLVSNFIFRVEVVLAPRSGFIENDLKKKFLSRFIEYIFSASDKIVCQSLYWKNLFINRLSIEEDKFYIVENGIDFGTYSKFPISPTNVNIILFMAWVDKNKGIFELIDAVELLSKDGMSFEVLVAGDGVSMERAKEIVERKNLQSYIKFLGWVRGHDKNHLLEKADIFVLPTHFEGYPNSLLEAMASGKACVSTKVGSIPDIIKNNVSGIVIDSKDSKALYMSLKKLINESNFRYEISIEARKSVLKRNSIELFSRRMTNILNGSI